MTDPTPNVRRWGRLLGGTTVLGMLFGMIGPYGSFGAQPISRVCFWVALFWAGTILLWPSMMATIRWAQRRSFPILLAMSVAMLVACLPLAAFAWVACRLLWPVHASGIRPQEWYVLTLIIAAPTTAVALWLEHFGGRWPDPAIPAPPGLADVLERLPDRLVDQVLCIQMEDHHVRAHTRGGSTLYYGSMRDVVDQLGPRGLQVHRSWWVAHGAVTGYGEMDRSFALDLGIGLRVPVARSRVPVVRAAGWLVTL